jgi:DNA-binding NarL/FixJ family response regulator
MTDAPIRVLLVDDHAAFLEPLAQLLAREPDLQVVGSAGALAELSDHLKLGVVADVVMLDLDLPDGDGANAIPDLRRANSETAILILTATRDERAYARAVAAGAAHVLHKSASVRDIVAAIRQLHAGETLVDPQQLVALLRIAAAQQEEERTARSALASLTPRELQVIQLLAQGQGNEAIANSLRMRPETVRVHVRNILAKLGVQSRLQAVIFAYRHGVVHINP